MQRQTFLHENSARSDYMQCAGDAAKPGVFYLPGHRNILENPNSARVVEACAAAGLGLTWAACWGWDGSTHPEIPEGGERYTAHWLTQALELFDALTNGPQIIIGYSMGGLLMLGLAVARRKRAKGLIGLAAGYGDEFANAVPERYGALAICDLDKTVMLPLTHDAPKTYGFPQPLDLTMPMRFYNDAQDAWVSPQTASNIMAAATSSDKRQDFKNNGTHRFDQPEDAAWLAAQLAHLTL